MQVDQAISYLEKSADLDNRDAAVYEIRTKRTDGSASGRGIFLREPLEARQSVSVTVDVKPVIHEVCHPSSTWGESTLPPAAACMQQSITAQVPLRPE